MLAHWPLNSLFGGDDVSSSNFHMNMESIIPSYTTGPTGTNNWAMMFKHGLESIASHQFKSLTTFTVTSWIQIINKRARGYIIKITEDQDNKDPIKIRISHHGLECGVGKGSSRSVASISYDFIIERWYHVVVVVNNMETHVTFYIDGEKQKTDEIKKTNSSTFISTTKIEVGSMVRGKEEDFMFSLSHVRLYDYALKGQQVIEIMKQDNTTG